MSTKDEIIKILEQNKGKYISGQALAEMLGLSRAAIWKTIKNMRQDGYAIDAVSRLGYMLLSENDVLSVPGILKFLPDYNPDKIFIYESIDSTNSEAKRRAMAGAVSGTVVIAEEQTAGKGRLGRSFSSPKQGGLYISFIIKPEQFNNRSLLLTLAGSVCACRAIERTTGLQPKIKWVNDLYLDNKKISGILTEAIMNFENGEIESIIIGVGINCNTDISSLPKDVRKVAGSLKAFMLLNKNTSYEYDDPQENDRETLPSKFNIPESEFTTTSTDHVDRNLLAANLIKELSSIESMCEDISFLNEYRKKCFILGMKVKIIKNSSLASAEEILNAPSGIALDISDSGALIVQYEDGSTEHLSSGEITVRF